MKSINCPFCKNKLSFSSRTKQNPNEIYCCYLCKKESPKIILRFNNEILESYSIWKILDNLSYWITSQNGIHQSTQLMIKKSKNDKSKLLMETKDFNTIDLNNISESCESIIRKLLLL